MQIPMMSVVVYMERDLINTYVAHLLTCACRFSDPLYAKELLARLDE